MDEEDVKESNVASSEFERFFKTPQVLSEKPKDIQIGIALKILHSEFQIPYAKLVEFVFGSAEAMDSLIGSNVRVTIRELMKGKGHELERKIHGFFSDVDSIFGRLIAQTQKYLESLGYVDHNLHTRDAGVHGVINTFLRQAETKVKDAFPSLAGYKKVQE